MELERSELASADLCRPLLISIWSEQLESTSARLKQHAQLNRWGSCGLWQRFVILFGSNSPPRVRQWGNVVNVLITRHCEQAYQNILLDCDSFLNVLWRATFESKPPPFCLCDVPQSCSCGVLIALFLCVCGRGRWWSVKEFAWNGRSVSANRPGMSLCFEGEVRVRWRSVPHTHTGRFLTLTVKTTASSDTGVAPVCLLCWPLVKWTQIARVRVERQGLLTGWQWWRRRWGDNGQTCVVCSYGTSLPPAPCDVMSIHCEEVAVLPSPVCVWSLGRL